MRWRLKKNEPAAAGIVRLVRADVATSCAAATKVLREPTVRRSKAVHRIRLCLKRDRAALRTLPGQVPAQLRLALRAAGRALAPLRDQEVMAATYERLAGRPPAMSTIANGNHELTGFRRGWETAQDHLERTVPLLAQLADLAPKIGLRLEVRRARHRAARAYAAASADPSTNLLHEWRKRLKAWSSMLELAGRDGGATARRLDRLQFLLGQSNDLARLSAAGLVIPEDDLASRLARRRHKLARRAIRLGRHVHSRQLAV